MATGVIPDITPAHTHAAPGSNTQICFNDAGVLAGDAGLTYDKATDTIGLAGKLDFIPDSVGEKISLYGVASYAVGVEANELRLTSGGTVVTLATGGYPGTARLQAFSTGVTLSSLAGTGQRTVTADASGTLTTTAPVVTNRSTSGAYANAAFGNLVANCLTGEVVTGGGCYSGGGSGLWFVYSNVNGNGWQCQFYNATGATQTMAAYAMCLR